MEVKEHWRFGRCAFATRAFAPGEVVLSESPLLITRNKTKPLSCQHQYIHDIAISTADDDVVLRDGCCRGSQVLRMHLDRFLAWSDAPQSIQQRALDRFQHHSDFNDSSCAVACEWAAGVIADRLLPRVPGLLPPEVCPQGAARGQQREAVERVLLAWELNAHSVGDRQALFELGSKLSHTCGAANTTYQSFGTRGYHVAMTHIAAGDMLTTCYLGPLDAIMPTPMRRSKLLDTFAFRCCCERCESAQDDTRDIPCPRCVPRRADGCLPRRVARGGVPPAGVMHFLAAPVSAEDHSSTSSSSSSSSSGGHEAQDDSHLCGPAPQASQGVAASAAAAGSAVNSRAPLWLCGTCGSCVGHDDRGAYGKLRLLNAAGGEAGAGCSMGRDDLREAPGLEVVLCMEGHVPLYDRQLLRRGALDWGEACRAVAATARSLGPCHYAHNMARLIHAEVALDELVRDVVCARDMGHEAHPDWVSDLMDEAAHYVDEAEDDWRRVWRWLHGRTSLQQLHPGYPVYQRLVYDTTKLLDARDVLLAAVPGPRGREVAARAQGVAALLLGWAEPIVDTCFGPWQTPERCPRAQDVARLRTRLASQQQLTATE